MAPQSLQRLHFVLAEDRPSGRLNPSTPKASDESMLKMPTLNYKCLVIRIVCTFLRNVYYAKASEPLTRTRIQALQSLQCLHTDECYLFVKIACSYILLYWHGWQPCLDHINPIRRGPTSARADYYHTFRPPQCTWHDGISAARLTWIASSPIAQLMCVLGVSPYESHHTYISWNRPGEGRTFPTRFLLIYISKSLDIDKHFSL